MPVEKRKQFRAAILTASDRAFAGVYVDKSGPTLRRILQAAGYEIAGEAVAPDEVAEISSSLVHFADAQNADLIVTTGGTGLGPRDVTPEATVAVCDRLVPGLSEWLRAESCKKKPLACLSRAVCGIRGRTLIVNLPGHPQAVEECMGFLLRVLPHALAMIEGKGHESA